MKLGLNKTFFLFYFFALSNPALAGAFIAGPIMGLTGFTAAVVGFAINMVASTIISKIFSPSKPQAASESSNPGNRQQIPPATDNKLPVVYGQAWVGGSIVDLSISSNNQNLYYVFAICEVTNNGLDVISFGDIYYGGKKVVFRSDGFTVDSLLDESTGIVNTSVSGKIQIYLYKNGSNQPANTTQNAITVMQSSGLTYTWDSSKLMTNCAFAIIKLTYSQDAGITGIEQTKFQVTNSRYKPGDCFLDYMTNNVYGGAIPLSQVNTDSLNSLNSYSEELFLYTDVNGDLKLQERFRFDGVLDTNKTIMENLQDMASCCDCLVKYNEITGLWGVIVQKPDYVVAMNLNDSNIVSSIQISPLDISSTYNVIECKFPDETNQDAFNSVTFDLEQIAPELLFPNEPVNKQSVSLPLVNNNVRAQYIANRMLEAAREDLQVQVDINFSGLQLEAGDIVTITNINYGWNNKLFRINKVVDQFSDDGLILSKLTMTEFNSSVYDDKDITEFALSPNTGIGSPTFFGSVPAPSVSSQYPSDVNPFFMVQATSSSSGIVQYAEIWYSAYLNPTEEQRIFAGTTEVQSSGNPWNPNTAFPLVQIANFPAGDWYFFVRMVNALAKSDFSAASIKFTWRPKTFQYINKYLAVAYATSIDGADFSFDPRNKVYYGLSNQESDSPSTNAADYTWFLADPSFGTSIYLCYSNRSGRKFSFATGFAALAAGSGSFVPTQTNLFDSRIWAALPDGTNIIDLDQSTGQVLETGSTTVGTGEIQVINSPDGKVVASLKKFLDFGPGVYQYTSSVATLTVDIYGRVVGLTPPDDFYYTSEQFNATSGQTEFSVNRASGYITGQCLVFKNGCLLETSEYTDNLTTVTLGTGCELNDRITIISFKSASGGTPYASFTRNTATLVDASSYTALGFTLNSGYELLFLNGTIVNEQDYDIVDQTITNFPDITSGLLTIIQWTPNNLGVPNGDPVNIVQYTTIGQTTYWNF